MCILRPSYMLVVTAVFLDMRNFLEVLKINALLLVFGYGGKKRTRATS